MAKELETKQSAKPEKASKVSKAATKDKKPKTHKISKFFKDLRSEFKKVIWPTKKQVINNTGVVLVTMVISSIFIWGFDTIFSQLLKLALGA